MDIVASAAVIAILGMLGAYFAGDFSVVSVVAYLAAYYVVITRSTSWRMVTAASLVTGYVTIIPLLYFFWGMLGPTALLFWTILVLWQVIPAMFMNLLVRQAGDFAKLVLLPLFLTAMLYLRCEVGLTKFAMATPIHALSGWSLRFLQFGGYAFVMSVLLATMGIDLTRSAKLRFYRYAGMIAAIVGASALLLTACYEPKQASFGPMVTGIQIEAGVTDKTTLRFASEAKILELLNHAYEANPRAMIFVLPEYAVPGRPSEQLHNWVKQHHSYLVVGGKDPDGDDFYNTAFVIGPDGHDAFSQAKAVPVPGLPDGFPAEKQDICPTTWGPVGLCVCYDLSFWEVCRQLKHLGARAIICPSMDLREWGWWEQQMNARWAPIRAAELGIPVLRVSSSGPSQLVWAGGEIQHTSKSPDDGETVSGFLPLQ